MWVISLNLGILSRWRTSFFTCCFFFFGIVVAYLVVANQTKGERKMKIKNQTMQKFIYASNFSRFMVAFVAFALSVQGIKAGEQSSQIKEQIKHIQAQFQSKIQKLESSLKITLEAERKAKDKTQAIQGSGYEHFHKQFREKNERIKDLHKHHNSNMQDNLTKAKDFAKEHNLSQEFSEFQSYILEISKSFLDKVKQKRAEIRLSSNPKEKSIYKEKTQYILAEFENEHIDLISDAYSAFIQQISEILGGNASK